MGLLAALTIVSIGLEAIILDAVSRLMSVPTGESVGPGFNSGGFGELTEAWSRSLSSSKVVGRFLEPTSLYFTTGQQAVLLMLSTIALLSIVRLMEVRQRGKIVSRFAFRVREHLITRFFNLRYAVFKQLSGRQVAHLASAEGSQAIQGLGHLLGVGSLGLSGVVYMAVAVFLNPFSTGIAIVLGVVVLSVMKMLSRRLREISVLHLELMSRFNRRVLEASAIYKHARITGARTEASSELSNLAGRIAASVKLRFDQASKVSAIQQPLLMFVLFSVLVLSLGFGLVTLAQTLIALGLIYRGVNCLMAAMSEYNNYINSRSSIDGLRGFIEYLASSDDDLLSIEDSISSSSCSLPIERIQGFDLGYSVNRTRILNGVSFDAYRGDVIGIFGHSGSGKSTLLEVMMGLVVPTSGFIKVNEMMFSEFVKADGRKKIGYFGSEMLASETAVLSQLSEHLKSPQKMRTFVDLIQSLECSDWTNSLISAILDGVDSELVGRLSMGQRQVLTLVNELLRSPEVIVFDEITAHMDPALLRKVFTHLKRDSKDRITFIVSHDVELLEFCSKALLINSGEARFFGDPEELRQRLHGDSAFLRAREVNESNLRFLVSSINEIEFRLSLAGEWVRCRLEEISIDGVGWVWIDSGVPDGLSVGFSTVAKIETDRHKLLIGGTIEELSDFGGRLVFGALDANTTEFLSALMRDVRMASGLEDVA